ncbi:hypothetical protein [Bacteroides reticulotermitis]|uniref:hypothetical protein n=1 Tax=Bacteroides reticulotermitis TaxID=1133319 RepID=UPI003A8C55F4
MKRLTKLSLFSLLSKPIQDESYQGKLENAYEELTNKTLQLYQTENDTVSIIRILNFARIELITLQSNKLYGEGEKCQKTLYYQGCPFFRVRDRVGLFTNR